MAKKKASVRNIAEICNVSVATVSRVLNNSSNVSEEKKKIILSVAQELGYITTDTSIAQENFIGILHPYIGIPQLTETEKHLEKILKENNYNALYASYHLNNDYTNHIKQMVELLYKNGAKAIVLFLTDVLDIKLDFNIPIIYAYLESDDYKNKDISISYDLYIGGKLAAYELLRNGATQPLILYNSHHSESSNQRYAGFIEAFNENGLEIDQNHIISANPNKDTFQDAYDIIHYLYMKGIHFDSIYAGSDWRAYGALTALQELQIEVPKEVKVIGFDGSNVAKRNSLPITSVEMSSYLFALNTFQLLSACINDQPIKEKQIIIPVQLFIGKSS